MDIYEGKTLGWTFRPRCSKCKVATRGSLLFSDMLWTVSRSVHHEFGVRGTSVRRGRSLFGLYGEVERSPGP